MPPLPINTHRGLLADHAGKRQLSMVRVHSAPAWLYVCRNVGSTSYPNLSTKGLLYGQTQIRPTKTIPYLRNRGHRFNGLRGKSTDRTDRCTARHSDVRPANCYLGSNGNAYEYAHPTNLNPHSYGNSDTYPYTNRDAYTNTDARSNEYSNVNSDCHTHTDARSNEYSNVNSDCYAHTDTNSDRHTQSNTNMDCHSYTDARSDEHSNVNSDCYAHTDANRDSYTYTNLYSYPYAHTLHP